MGINKVILIGRLGKDPEIRYAPDGTPVATFSIATNYHWTDSKTGKKKSGVDWHRIVVWGKRGEICGEYLEKGRQVYIEGKLKTRSWEKDGHTNYITEVIARDVQFLGSSSEKVGDGRYQPVDSGASGLDDIQPRKDDDIPF